MMPLYWIVGAIIVVFLSGFAGLVFSRCANQGQRISSALMVIGSLCGLAGAVTSVYQSGAEAVVALHWPAVGGGQLAIDGLSAFFLVPIFLMAAVGSVYGLEYWPERRHPANARRVQVFWGLMTAGMALLVISRHALIFLVGWELMALSAFFLVSAEDHLEECRRSGWLYLAATHIGSLSLLAFIIIWRQQVGSFTMMGVCSGQLSKSVVNWLMVLALISFGMKAGIMPLHFWLPGAHANAPSHVSAMMSGVLLKMGIYGLVRFVSLLPADCTGWAGLIVALGIISGLLGVIFALGQHDIKRLLAYHSIENIGIILLGLGLAMFGRVQHQPVWVVLGLGGCLLHTWNHALFKGLLFLSAGAVVHRTHNRQLDRLGGLAKQMPWTAAFFLVGATAICGLPPLNGFISELLVYLGLFRSLVSEKFVFMSLALAVPSLAMIGALAVACFVKAYGIVFLGSPRSASAEDCPEVGWLMRLPMGVLAFGCVLIGVAPFVISTMLDKAIGAWASSESSLLLPAMAQVVELKTISIWCFSAAIIVGIGLWGYRRKIAHADRTVTWDCGYVRPTFKMQYTATSLAQMLVEMFCWILRPQAHRPGLHTLFAHPETFHIHIGDVILDRVIVPLAQQTQRIASWFKRFQQGSIHQYLFYIFVTVVVLLCVLLPIEDLFSSLF